MELKVEKTADKVTLTIKSEIKELAEYLMALIESDAAFVKDGDGILQIDEIKDAELKIIVKASEVKKREIERVIIRELKKKYCVGFCPACDLNKACHGIEEG